jgi:rhodanese-related sulfurtransferase
MHIHELNPWRTLIALSAFVILLIIGFFTMKKPLVSYQLNMDESITELTESDLYFSPWELDAVISGEIDTIVLFDIRDNFVFGQGHIPGAENISANDLADEDNIERLKVLKEKGTTVVLYGEDELQANGPMMLFRQVGFDNIKVLLGGYQYYHENKDDLYSTLEDDAYMKGYARFDYVEMAAPKDGVAGMETGKKPVQVQRRQKASVAAGGC